MMPVDERLIELSRSDTGITAKRADELGVATKEHLSPRLVTLTDYGLLCRVAYGRYKISDQGRAYLDGELDASALSPDE